MVIQVAINTLGSHPEGAGRVWSYLYTVTVIAIDIETISLYYCPMLCDDKDGAES